jgi:hypothetical protein
VKQLKTRDTESYNPKIEWKREVDAIQSFNTLNHPNITRGIAAFSQNDTYYILLEWANGDNLRTLWKNNRRPTLNPVTIRELLYQLWGLADGLYQMHHDTPFSPYEDTRTNSPTDSEFSENLPETVSQVDFTLKNIVPDTQGYGSCYYVSSNTSVF